MRHPIPLLTEALELAELLEPAWARELAELEASGLPLNALTPAAARAALDAALTGVTHIEWSANGTTVSTEVAATAVTLESAVDQTTFQRKAVDVASPPLLSAAASAIVTINHYRLTTASTGGTAKTAFVPLTSPITLAIGEKISIADAALGEKWTAGT